MDAILGCNLCWYAQLQGTLTNRGAKDAAMQRSSTVSSTTTDPIPSRRSAILRASISARRASLSSELSPSSASFMADVRIACSRPFDGSPGGPTPARRSSATIHSDFAFARTPFVLASAWRSVRGNFFSIASASSDALPPLSEQHTRTSCALRHLAAQMRPLSGRCVGIPLPSGMKALATRTASNTPAT